MVLPVFKNMIYKGMCQELYHCTCFICWGKYGITTVHVFLNILHQYMLKNNKNMVLTCFMFKKNIYRSMQYDKNMVLALCMFFFKCVSLVYNMLKNNKNMVLPCFMLKNMICLKRITEKHGFTTVHVKIVIYRSIYWKKKQKQTWYNHCIC